MRSDGWNIIRYYLHRVDDQDVLAGTPGVGKPDNTRIEKVVYYAGRIFSVYVAKRGVGRFESDVLQRAGMGHLGTTWLQRQFIRLAAEFSGFTYAGWEVLCLNDMGRSCLSELLFQMRLLWAEWLRNGTSPSDGIPAIQNGSGLLKRVEEALAVLFTGYVQQRGVVRFHRDIIMRLQQRTIGLGERKGKEKRDRLVFAPSPAEGGANCPQGGGRARQCVALSTTALRWLRDSTRFAILGGCGERNSERSQRR